MRKGEPLSTGARIRAIVLVVVLLAVALGAVTWYVDLRDRGLQAEAEYQQDAKAPPPAGHGEKGVKLVEGEGKEVVVMTDMSCPHCQELFASRGDEIRRLVDSGEHTVWLQVLEVRAESRTNKIALRYWLYSMRQPGVNSLRTYLALSRAVSGVPDDERSEVVESRVRRALAPHVEDVPKKAPSLSRSDRRWLEARTYENRESVGSVPSLTVDGESKDIEDLASLTEGSPSSGAGQ